MVLVKLQFGAGYGVGDTPVWSGICSTAFYALAPAPLAETLANCTNDVSKLAASSAIIAGHW